MFIRSSSSKVFPAAFFQDVLPFIERRTSVTPAAVGLLNRWSFNKVSLSLVISRTPCS
jgi:hypothetical protein